MPLSLSQLLSALKAVHQVCRVDLVQLPKSLIRVKKFLMHASSEFEFHILFLWTGVPLHIRNSVHMLVYFLESLDEFLVLHRPLLKHSFLLHYPQENLMHRKLWIQLFKIHPSNFLADKIQLTVGQGLSQQGHVYFIV